jgi:hypothetical protein
MKPVYRNLSSRKHALMQSTLRLLVAMVTQSSSTTRELFDTFNFTLKVGNFPCILTIRCWECEALPNLSMRLVYL